MINSLHQANYGGLSQKCGKTLGMDFGFRGKWEYPGVCLPTFQREYGGRKEGFPIDPREPFEQKLINLRRVWINPSLCYQLSG